MAATETRSELVLTEWPRPEVALLRLNRPETLNALTRPMLDVLGDELERLQDTAGVRAAILTGVGRGFCSGHDLTDLDREAASEDIDEQMTNQRAFSRLIERVHGLRLPVVAAVNGPAAGGGLALALAADTRVCSESARFNVAMVRLGISGGDVGISYLLPRVVGPTLAFEMMVTGRLVGPEEALRSGLVLRIAPDGEVIAAALEIADEICANSPFAVEMTKELMWANFEAPSLRAAVVTEDRTQTLCLQTKDWERALPAVREKRPADWT
jgi:enoyl-CoA hydratase